jgi:hypothetical protein
MADNVFLKIEYLPNAETIANNKSLADKAKARAFYSCNQPNDYVKYVHTGISNYLAYTGDIAKSSGIFGKDGLLDDKAKAELRARLRETKSVIWHGLVSFDRDFSDKYCDDWQTAFAMLQKEIPRFLQQAHLDPDNITWYAGFHENTEHRHIHFSFFENEPTRFNSTDKANGSLLFSQGRIVPYALESFKRNIELYLYNHVIFPKRDKLLQDFKFLVNADEIRKVLAKLGKALPHKENGYLYSYNNAEMKYFRVYVDQAVMDIILRDRDSLYEYNEFCRTIAEQDQAILQMCNGNMEKYERLKLADKYMLTLKTRLGNALLNSLNDIEKWERELQRKIYDNWKDRRIRKNHRNHIFDECLRLSAKCNKEIVDCFQEFLRKLRTAEHKRLIEEGLIDPEM